MRKFWVLLILASTFLISCSKQELVDFTADNEFIRYAGRVDFSNPEEPVLISSASYVEFNFEGESCELLLKKTNPPEEQNYVSIELDGIDKGRFKITSDTLSYLNVSADTPGIHHLKIFKSTEAQTNHVVFGGVKCLALKPLDELPTRKIEFIGNSITCGMGNDLSDIPCDSGHWFDQHNAYLAYGPTSARALNAQMMLSSLSGFGIYRNWNSLSPVMPDVYENMYLNTDNSKPWDFSSYQPDLVSICLGTNDFSLGDGIKERLPFDSVAFVGAYIGFLNTVYSHYPNTQVCLLTSPMVRDESAITFKNCLDAVKSHFDEEGLEKSIAIFEFPSEIEPHGCLYHPDIDDHQQMADALLPFYKELMDW